MKEAFTGYLTDVVGRHADDECVLPWDLRHEPLMARYVGDAAGHPGRPSCAGWAGPATSAGPRGRASR